MKYEFFSGESAAVEEINPFTWIAGVIVLQLLCITFLAWILIWAADNGTDTLRAWGIQFMMAVVQDILLNQPIKLYIMHVLAVEILRPRLRHIYNILNNVLSRAGWDANEVDGKKQMFAVAVVQHMSAACRAARTKLCSMLPSSRMLAAITDYDVFLCREAPHSSLTLVSFILVLIPTVLALTNEWIQDGCLTVGITAIWALFMIVNEQLLQISIWALIAPYLFIFLVIVIDLFVLSPRRKRAPTPSKHTGLERHGGKGWRRTARQHSVLVSKPFNDRTKSLMKKIGHELPSFETNNTKKRKVEVLWRNINLPHKLQANVARSNNNVTRFKVRRKLIHQETSMGTNDRDQLAVISPEVLDMRFSSLQNSVRQRKKISLKKRMDSFLWQPDALSHQCEANADSQSVSATGVPPILSRSSSAQNWLQFRKAVDIDATYWLAHQAFVGYDKNKSGYLETEEIQHLAKSVWQIFNPDLDFSEDECDDVVDGLLCQLDPDGTQCVTFEAFLPWYTRLELSMREHELKNERQLAEGRLSRGFRGIRYMEETTLPVTKNDKGVEETTNDSIVVTDIIRLF